MGDRHSSMVGGPVGRPGTRAGQRTRQPPIPGRTCKPSPAGRPGRRELASSSGKESRAAPQAVACQIQTSPLQPSYPTRKARRTPLRAAPRSTWALHPWVRGSALCANTAMRARPLLVKNVAVRVRPLLAKDTGPEPTTGLCLADVLPFFNCKGTSSHSATF